ncbi:SDR family NAD(P)-dependent oxidoreductase [Bradyrhizobium cenepequi]|uniref:SDR family NAD(P)-dependent oxidoreductase n=1 Tax=Bradyrhizobium cenepequi TaxID=2821403 RepID=UPI001CE2F77F|nr:SDR family NAD(P)-dependent oxidoreductase [Bradyrhizobium cenepequi]MCA6111203.1 SDR family NAD(P)-dependent oxidoreductase [Bradyrhizobium cenepequi]
MDLNRVGRRALMTGSSSGLGEAIVKFLAQEGAAAVVHSQNEALVSPVADAIAATGAKVDRAFGDLSTDEGADAVCARALADGAIDILLNNAEGVKAALDGVDILVDNVGNPTHEVHSPWFDAPLHEWVADYHQNTLASVRLIHAFVPAMKECGCPSDQHQTSDEVIK